MQIKPTIVKASLLMLLILFSGVITWAIMPNHKDRQNDKVPTKSPNRNIDPRADKLLKDMSKALSGMNKFSFTAQGYFEVVLDSLRQKIQITNGGNIHVQRPDKIKVERTGEIADMEMYGNKGNFTIYGKKLNMYATTFTGNTLDHTIDFLQENLDMPLPASDLLYSDVYSTLMQDVNTGYYLGQSIAGNEVCDHLAFSGDEVDWQIWIDSKNLPRKYVITSKEVEGWPEYSIEIMQWNTNPKFKDNLFVFTPPAKAEKLDFVTKKDAQTRNPIDK